MAFDVIEAQPVQPLLRRAPPARLSKLDVGKRKSEELTKQQIEEKLARAEQRKKDKEQARLRKMHSLANHHHEIQESQQEVQVQHQKELREQTVEKVDTAATNREKQLQEKIAKQKAREERAAKVRLRKKLHIPTQEELDEIEARQLAEQKLLTTANSIALPRDEDSLLENSDSNLKKRSPDDSNNCSDQAPESMEIKTVEESVIAILSTDEKVLERAEEGAENSEAYIRNFEPEQPDSTTENQ